MALRISRYLASDNSGSVAVETALALLLAFPVIITCFELCLFAYAQTILGDAARVGVRYAIVHGTNSATCSGPSTGCGDSTGANIASTTKTYASGSFAALSGATVSVSYPDGSSAPPSRVIVTLRYTYLPTFGSIRLGNAMYAVAEGRIVY